MPAVIEAFFFTSIALLILWGSSWSTKLCDFVSHVINDVKQSLPTWLLNYVRSQLWFLLF